MISFPNRKSGVRCLSRRQTVYRPGAESLDVRLHEEHEIPWNELAFPVVKLTLARYYEDMRRGSFPVHVEDIHRHPARTK